MLTAMVFAVAMMFIDQTIVAIAVPATHIAQATQTVYRSMAGVMTACLTVAIVGMRRGRAI